MKVILKCKECQGTDFEFSSHGDYVYCTECEESVFIEDLDIDITYEG